MFILSHLGISQSGDQIYVKRVSLSSYLSTLQVCGNCSLVNWSYSISVQDFLFLFFFLWKGGDGGCRMVKVWGKIHRKEILMCIIQLKVIMENFLWDLMSLVTRLSMTMIMMMTGIFLFWYPKLVSWNRVMKISDSRTFIISCMPFYSG